MQVMKFTNSTEKLTFDVIAEIKSLSWSANYLLTKKSLTQITSTITISKGFIAIAIQSMSQSKKWFSVNFVKIGFIQIA